MDFNINQKVIFQKENQKIEFLCFHKWDSEIKTAWKFYSLQTDQLAIVEYDKNTKIITINGAFNGKYVED